MMEVEALESIYMDDFTSTVYLQNSCSSLSGHVELSDSPLIFQIHLVPNQDGGNNHGIFFYNFLG
jgi:hypothetical protein